MLLFLPVDASVVVMPVEELDLLKGLLAGVITGQIRVHAKKQVECRRAWGERKTEWSRQERNKERKDYYVPSTVTYDAKATATP